MIRKSFNRQSVNDIDIFTQDFGLDRERLGSPPLMRERQGLSRLFLGNLRITPAYAGKTKYIL